MASFAARATGASVCGKRFYPFGQTMARALTTHTTSYTLNSGAKIPALGLGTFQEPHSLEEIVSRALQKGTRGIKKSGIPRKGIFLCTKLWCNYYHPDVVEGALDDTLRDLDTPYVDLLMMHYPCTFKREPDLFPGERRWKNDWQDQGHGVSNFSKGEIKTLLEESSTAPALHQMEVHPYFQQTSFNEWLRARGIHVVQFSPLGNTNDFYRQTGCSKEIAHMMRVIDQPILKEVGQKYGKSPVQVVLAWGIHSGGSVILKSVVDWQIEKNLEAATLNAKARFNDPSLDYARRLYSDLGGIDGTMMGRTH
ncbi:aldo/keto reductase family protein [Aspergillus alliaceus]|uniref:aldo/keto reductase family protein n=1 Tax=Petromyces alliaceus TaxID=209559 RepID=UPI0012A3BE6E|nr:NADP-dependent oxidoreductase domain-containing protein [Aspergillus alliaceus]KAB8239056.1 NADP-dependent oxidoreductase domain-containing protein [Aspergillus alliaceus]